MSCTRQGLERLTRPVGRTTTENRRAGAQGALGPVILLAVLIYGTLHWSRRRRGRTQGSNHASALSGRCVCRLKSGKKQGWRETTLRINAAEPIILSHDHVAAARELLGRCRKAAVVGMIRPAGTLSRVTEKRNACRRPTLACETNDKGRRSNL